MLALTGTLILFLCNHDGYHFFWLVSIMYPLIVVSFVLLSIPLAPAPLAQVLKAGRDTVWSWPRKTLMLAFFWVALFSGLGYAYIVGLEYLREVEWGFFTAHAAGEVVALEHTSSKGGPVEWAIYEYNVGGVTIRSAVRNASRGLGRGQALDIAYTTFWPRYSNPHTANLNINIK